MGIYDRDWDKEKGTSASSNEPPKIDPKYKREFVGNYNQTSGSGTTSSKFSSSYTDAANSENKKEGSNIYCFKCGKGIRTGGPFCSYCGTKQHEEKPVNNSYKKNNKNYESVVKRQRQRHGFTTFWLVLVLCFGVIGVFFSFSDTNDPIDILIENILRSLGLRSEAVVIYESIVPFLVIASALLLLNWKKIGFWLIIIRDVIGAFIYTNTVIGFTILLLLSLLMDFILFGILSLRKNGVSTWEQLE